MNITDVRVKKFEGQNRLKAIVAMPSRKMPNGEFKDVAHPINQETRNMIENAVIEAYNQLPEDINEE